MKLLRLVCLFVLISIQSTLAGEETEKLVLATYKLFNEAVTATGFIVKTDDRTFVVSAAHVFEGMRGDQFLLVARKAEEDGEYRRNDRPVPIRADGKPLWKKHPKQDIAVLPLPDDFDEPGLPFEALAEDSGMKVGDELRITTYPEKFEANGAGFPALRIGIVASFPLTPHKIHGTFLIDMTSWGGDSGGPVILADEAEPVVVGIVSGKHQITDSSNESRYVERKVHYPLNISFAVHASFARQLILDFKE